MPAWKDIVRPLVPLLVLVAALALIVQASGANQSSHFSLVRALDSGTAKIDRWHEETIDKSFYEDHYYSVKAPGMALFSTPLYWATDSVGIVGWAETKGEGVTAGTDITRGDPVREALVKQTPVVWMLTLWAVLLPFLALLILMRWAVERLAPGYGTVAAAAVGLGTLLLPFATMFYSHLPAAALVFASYVLLLRDRPLWAGVAGGLAVVFEYPAAFAVLVLLVWCRSPKYVLGGIAGGLPLPIYNLLAFGNPTHMSYKDVVGFSQQDDGLFGITVPKPGAMIDILFEPTGLLVMSPIVAVGVYGLIRARQWAPLAIVVVTFLYNAGYWLPFGGESPGPRFFVTALPFLVLGVAVALRERTAPALGLAAASVVGMVAATVTEPQIEDQDTSQWWDLVTDGELQYTLAGAVGASNDWIGMAPLILLLGVAIVLALRTLPRAAVDAQGLVIAAGVLAVWGIVAGLAGDAPELTVAGVVAGAAAAVWVTLRAPTAPVAAAPPAPVATAAG